ncbi:MAG: hypothetical protein ACYS9Y_00880 [Planctomycetota bacterium]
MNRRQKAILINVISVITITSIAVVAMINLKDWVNHSEAMRAMEHLGKLVLQYRQENGSVPPQSYVDNIKTNLKGHARLGKLQYRALWIDFDSIPDDVLAYVEKKYRSFVLSNGFIVLRLDGRVEWMQKQQLDILLARQQSRMEIEKLRK